MIQTTKYIRKPLIVDVIQVTDENFEAVADWCQGEIKPQGDGDHGRYIFVRVHSPRNPRQTKAYVGDWILYTERGYKVYTTKAFEASFELVENHEATASASLSTTEEM